MLFKIDFEVDNGAYYQRDIALVKAENADAAKEKLRRFINRIDSETCVYKIYSINLFSGDIFTGRHGTN